MKKTLLFAALISCCTYLTAQTINLPDYKQGQYEIDTVYSEGNSISTSGEGYINFGGMLATGFITGVEFKMVVDDIDPGPSPTHTAFRDSSGTLVPMYVGDTISVPMSFMLYAGNMGFHIIVEGTPQVANESYLCDLGFAFTLGDDYNMLIKENTLTMCVVDQAQGINVNEGLQEAIVYPNPFGQFTTIQFDNKSAEPHELLLFDTGGKQVLMVNGIMSNKVRLDKNDLAAGIYYFQLNSSKHTIAKGKLVVEQ